MSPSSADGILNLDSVSQRGHLADQVARQLAALIQDGTLTPGDKLPTEARLVEDLKVSRSVVREAIARLQSEGFVESHQGKGVFVVDWSSRRPFRLDGEQISAPDDLAALIELRVELESGAAALAASRRNDKECAYLRDCVERMAQAGDDTSVSEADLDFHIGIAKATHNAYYQDLSRYLNRHIRVAIAQCYRPTTNYGGTRQVLLEEHRAILTAIERGDAVTARSAMRRHLSRVMERLSLSEPAHA